MEFLTTLPNGAKLYSDYGHIASSLSLGYQMLRERYPDHKITAIFQPHQMHRVLTGRAEFPAALAPFDERAIYSIYAAREKIEDFAHEPLFQEKKLTSVAQLSACFAEHVDAEYLVTFEDFQNFLAQREEYEVVVLFTAGELDFQLRKVLDLLEKG